MAFFLKRSGVNVSNTGTEIMEAKMALAPVRDNSVVSRLVEVLESLSRPDAKYPQAIGIV